jgi:hypothetical protein
MSFASHFRPCRRLPLRDDGLAHGRGDLAPLLAKADRVLPVIDPTPARAVIGDRRGVPAVSSARAKQNRRARAVAVSGLAMVFVSASRPAP